MRRLVFILFISICANAYSDEQYCIDKSEKGFVDKVFTEVLGVNIDKVHSSAEEKFSIVNNVYSLSELERELNKAKVKGQESLVLIWAEWSSESKVIANGVFKDSDVKKHIANMQIIGVDTTKFDDVTSKVLKKLRTYGPPTIIHYSAAGELKGKINKCVEPKELVSWLQARK